MVSSRGESGIGSRSTRSGHHPGHRTASLSAPKCGVVDPHNLHQPGIATEWNYYSATPDAYMGGRTIQAQNISSPFDPMDKDMHQNVLRYGGDGFFFHEPVPPSIFDPPHLEKKDTTVGGLIKMDALNDKQLLRNRVYEARQGIVWKR